MIFLSPLMIYFVSGPSGTVALVSARQSPPAVVVLCSCAGCTCLSVCAAAAQCRKLLCCAEVHSSAHCTHLRWAVVHCMPCQAVEHCMPGQHCVLSQPVWPGKVRDAENAGGA